jgi:hypothetical protein
MVKPLSRQGTCVYCGNIGEVTLDHVIPQCLFPGHIPKDAPIVDACQKCNGEMKSAFDEYLRDMLVNDMSSSRNPIAKRLLAKYARASARNRSLLDRDLHRDYDTIGLIKPSGIIGSFADISWIVNERVRIIMQMMIRGLFRYYLQEILSVNTPIDISRVINMQFIEKTIRELYEQGGKHACIGTGDVFECAFVNSQEDPYISVWVLNFYRSVVFFAFTSMPKSEIVVVH